MPSQQSLDIQEWKAKLKEYEARRRLMGNVKWCEYMMDRYGNDDDQVLLRSNLNTQYPYTIAGQSEMEPIWDKIQRHFMTHYRYTQRYSYYKVPLWLVATALNIYPDRPLAAVHPKSICQTIVSNGVKKRSKKG